MMIEHDRAVPMIEQTTDRVKLDHDLIVPITNEMGATEMRRRENSQK